MTYTRRTNYFVLLLFINQYIWSFLWPLIVPMLGLGVTGQGILSQVLFFLLPAAIYFVYTKEPIFKTLALKPLSFKNIVIIVLLSFAIQPFMSVLAAISSFFFPNNVSDALTAMRLDGYFMMFFSIAIVPAFCEELFFRGIVFSGYRLQPLFRACLFTGLLFGLMHMDGQQFAYAFALGTLFCFLRFRTGSLFAPMLSHFIINGTQVTLAYFADNSGAVMPSHGSFAAGIILLLFALVILGLSFVALGLAFWWFLKANPIPHTVEDGIIPYQPPKDWKEELIDIPFFLIVAIYVFDVVIGPIVASWM